MIAAGVFGYIIAYIGEVRKGGVRRADCITVPAAGYVVPCFTFQPGEDSMAQPKDQERERSQPQPQQPDEGTRTREGDETPPVTQPGTGYGSGGATGGGSGGSGTGGGSGG